MDKEIISYLFGPGMIHPGCAGLVNTGTGNRFFAALHAGSRANIFHFCVFRVKTELVEAKNLKNFATSFENNGHLNRLIHVTFDYAKFLLIFCTCTGSHVATKVYLFLVIVPVFTIKR